jgi:hypothetical protein
LTKFAYDDYRPSRQIVRWYFEEEKEDENRGFSVSGDIE